MQVGCDGYAYGRTRIAGGRTFLECGQPVDDRTRLTFDVFDDTWWAMSTIVLTDGSMALAFEQIRGSY